MENNIELTRTTMILVPWSLFPVFLSGFPKTFLLRLIPLQ